MGEADKTNTEIQNELDGMTLNIEFTLISIIQGVALYFLTDNARTPLLQWQYEYWPYLITGLLTIFTFWSRSILHTFTVIRWPSEYKHKFMYITCTLVEAIAFTQLSDPVHWFALNALYSCCVWFLFIFDLRIIRRRQQDSSGPYGDQLFAIIERDQLQNIRLWTPAYIAFNLLAYATLALKPSVFYKWTIWLGMLQMLGSFIYLRYGLLLYQRLCPLILKTRAEWRPQVQNNYK
jgi:hypothetical protein